MHWQEITALTIVGVTIGLFIWRRVRRNSAGGLPGCRCADSSGRPPRVVLRAKKGERPQMIVKMK